eukprot:EG_transcript_16833
MAEPIFVVNGFYMAMREKYTQRDASIHYLVVEWDPAVLTWRDFRGKVLGATDPTVAAAGSIRQAILQRWQALGLQSEPSIGDNGVHGSASPLEGLAERLNWLGRAVEDDPFGQTLLAAGIPRATLLGWLRDAQVEVDGRAQSLFDVLEDTDSGPCLARMQAIAGGRGPRLPVGNHAFVFVKPHAMTPAVVQLVVGRLKAVGVEVRAEGVLAGPTIAARQLIDHHYYALASKAVLQQPRDLRPASDKQLAFAALFGLPWPAAVAHGRVYNAAEGCAALGWTGRQMDAAWAQAKVAGRTLKMGGGFACALLSPADLAGGAAPLPADPSGLRLVCRGSLVGRYGHDGVAWLDDAELC